jgi:hypothetical protein
VRQVPDRDWSKELAKIDKQLESVSDEALLPAKPGPSRGAPAAAPKPGPAIEPTGTHSFGVFARLTLSVVLGVAIVLWPYQARCGFGLAAYLGAVAVVALGGGWSAVWTWRHRAAKAHTLSLLLVAWGLVLGAAEVLPRIGYAKPDGRHPATWICP